jgi:hypothetical protein
MKERNWKNYGKEIRKDRLAAFHALFNDGITSV